jgi:hypothetical protein
MFKTPYQAMRTVPKSSSPLNKGDTLVLFGELFNRGYANGLVEEAQKRDMNIVYSTVGRREKDGTLRALNSEEAQLSGKPLINIPLEAGFDLENDSSGQCLVDLLKDVKLSDWLSFKPSESFIKEVQQKALQRFRNQVKTWAAELQKHIEPTGHLVIAHLMAGGVPRAKIIMPLMNRIFKGQGERHISSELFWNSALGQVVSKNFDFVTADTFAILLEETKAIRELWKEKGFEVSYTAYGYHGTEVLMNDKYVWQTYSPYLQGFAKMKLEKYSFDYNKQGVNCCVYNCPEILTNSSSIFNGVEVSLYPLLPALQKESPRNPNALKVLENCTNKLKIENSLEKIKEFAANYLSSDIIINHCLFDQWPQHNSLSQMEKMLTSSDELISFHTDEKDLITSALSEVVFNICGKAMLSDMPKPMAPVIWLNHDLIAKNI